MMNILVALLLIVVQFFTGMGLLGFFRVKLKPGLYFSLCLLLGVAVFSFVPFLLQLIMLPLTSTNIFLALLATCIWLNIHFKKNMEECRRMIRESRVRIRIYEIPFLLIITGIALISIWRCYYLPPTPRDLTSGAEVIAEYAVKEKTMINSVFTVNLETTNNQFKPPFITSLQIIYKYAGFPFGQIWLSTLFVSFLIFLYHALCRRIHRLLAGLLIVFFLAIPEMYAYTFMVLFDYSNAIFFFLSFYFLIEYFKIRQANYIALSGLLMGIATYIRSETLILAGLILPLILWHHWRRKDGIKRLLTAGVWFFAPSVVFYFLSITLYFNFYLPVKYDVQGLVNNNLLNLQPIWQRWLAMNKQLIFSKDGIDYYAYFFFIFLLVLLADLIISHKLNRNSRNWLYAILVVYLGMPILGYLLPLLDIDNSTKRGLFRIFPLMLLYMGTSPAITLLSSKIRQWERG
jgi:hypothetical protein